MKSALFGKISKERQTAGKPILPRKTYPRLTFGLRHFRTAGRSPSGNPAGFGFDNHQGRQSFLNRNF
ncbi:hypothetical protein QWJ46_15775 [Rhizobium sp. CBN3]|uniref:hypothetical protein n=1 Tax=Rhizobium sp. CBN3 TaxID=3058045 RepID=UPI00267249B8|nr:hypothetical protein [Rhizobium sp. CBN3]MDO3434145.1 hypothetical protein [Rhizobium sp. CBN3]